MMIEGIESLNENDAIGINESLFYNGIFFYNMDNTPKSLNTSLSKNENKDLSNTYFPLSHLINKDNFNVIKNEGVSTDFLSKQEQNNNEPQFYSLENIFKIFKKNENEDKFKEIINKLNNEEVKAPAKLIGKKRKICSYEDKYGYIYSLMDKTKQKENKIEKLNEPNNKNNKRGRKTNKTKNIGIHDKMAPDNIIKKIKVNIFEFPVLFLNNILDNNNKKDKLFKLDYKYINRINREQDLKFLNMSLKELFSKKISRRYIAEKRQEDFNKKYIENILKDQKDNTILFIFNITFRDWLDLFTLKKNINEIIIKYNYLDKDIDCEKIQKNIYGVDILLNKIMNENDKEYLTNFIFLLYNYERWFYNRIGRRSKKSIN